MEPSVLKDVFKAMIGKIISDINAKMPKYKHISNYEVLETALEKTTTRKIKRFGNNVRFGSDAHIAARLGEKYYLVADFLKSIGINYAFKYLAHKPIAKLKTCW